MSYSVDIYHDQFTKAIAFVELTISSLLHYDDREMGMFSKLISYCVCWRRVENQNLNQTGALRVFGWVIGVQLDSQANECSPDAENNVRLFQGCKETF